MTLVNRGRRLGHVALVLAAAALGASCTKRADPTEKVFADFHQRIDQYVELHRHMADSVGVIDETKSQAEISVRGTMLANRIIAARASAKQGDIFTTEAATVIATMIREEYRRRAPKIRDSREDAQEELPDFVPTVNQIYPTTYPLATFPATLIPLLPPLPEELEYRISGHYLLLRDIQANLIVDFMPNAVP